MKKLAYLGFSYVSGTLKRAEAYIRHNPDLNHTFIAVDDFTEYADWLETSVAELKFFRDNGIPIVMMQDVKAADFDLVLPMSDKAFDDFLVFTGRNGIKNICDKEILSTESAAFGFDIPKTFGFKDNDLVIAKPRLSSGSYAEEDFCYKKIVFAELKAAMAEVDESKFIVQEFIDSSQVLQFNFISDGTKIIPDGISDFQFMTDLGQKTDPIYMTCFPSVAKLVEHVDNLSFEDIADLQKRASSFLKSHHYDSIPGFYTFQVIVQNNKFYVNDINLRIGPGSVEAGLKNLYQMNYFTNVKVMMGDAALEDLPHDKNVGYTLYLEKDGKRLVSPSKKFKEDFENRIRCIEKKTSGFIRNDYESYIQATRI